MSYGEDTKNRVITNDDLISNKDKFFHSNDNLDLIGFFFSRRPEP